MNNNQNNNPEVKIQKRYSFLAFVREYGKPEVFDDMVNGQTGEMFTIIKFHGNEDETTAFLGKSVRDYKYDQLLAEVKELEVGEGDNGKFYVYKRKQGKMMELANLVNEF
jgi:hypothetical protein